MCLTFRYAGNGAGICAPRSLQKRNASILFAYWGSFLRRRSVAFAYRADSPLDMVSRFPPHKFCHPVKLEMKINVSLPDRYGMAFTFCFLLTGSAHCTSREVRASALAENPSSLCCSRRAFWKKRNRPRRSTVIRQSCNEIFCPKIF